MNLQKMSIQSGKTRVYIKTIKMNGELEYTSDLEDALVWPKHMWDIFLEETDINKWNPLPINVED